MALKYRLGLDVGTASVGAAAVSLDDNGQPNELIWHYVRIFNEPLENAQGTLVSKKAGRRKARMQRRQIDRRASRLRRIAHLSSLLGLKREEIKPDSGNTLPYLRAKAATERVELADLLRIFLRLSKRRGYKGEFKAKKKGEVAEGSNELSTAMKALAVERGIALKNENHTGITLGQYLLHRLENGLPTKLKVKEHNSQAESKKDQNENGVKNLYALRNMIEYEFDTIWKTQSEHHDILKESHKGKPIHDYFYEALFYQRPLKSAACLVGQCSLEPTLPRAPRAQIAFQRFRIEKTLADLRWGAGKRAEPLTPDQKKVIRDLLDKNDKVEFTAIYDALEQAGLTKPQGKGLNLDRVSREELLGNSTLSALRKLDRHSHKHHPERAANLEKSFRALDKKTQIAVINFLAELGSPEQLDDPEWPRQIATSTGIRRFESAFINPEIYLQEFNGKPEQKRGANYLELIKFINSIKEHDKFGRLSQMDFDGGRAAYSVKALNKLTEWLQEPNWPGNWEGDMDRIDEEAAVRVCYAETFSRNIERMEKLPSPKPTGNAVVDGSLRQIRWTVNKMITELGTPPSEIVVELSREMSLGIDLRNKREIENSKQQKTRRRAEKEIRALNQTPTPSKIRRYLLWEEQDSLCPYCNKAIEASDALSGGATEYEHIIPRSLTQVGMKSSEIVLAHHMCNQDKGDCTPWDAWGNTDRWQYIEKAAERLEKKRLFRKAKLLLLRDFEREVITDETISGFADRQFHQTSWIAKEAAQWLRSLCPNKVSVSRGELTALLRRNWRLDTAIPEVRIENNLPVFDDEGKQITPEDFAELKKHLEGHPVSAEDRKGNPGFNFSRRLDKRLDHRHNLIDAITLALTSRSLFQEMARKYKIEANRVLARDGETTEEHERRIKHGSRLRLEAPEPPMRNVRTIALNAVRECRISIKPDRYPDGAFFKDTAYGVGQREGEDKLRLTLRRSITGLGKDGKGKITVESARKVIHDIVSDEVRGIISTIFENRITSGMEPTAALALPIMHPLYNKPIHKVRCFEAYAEDAQPIGFFSRLGEHRKYLVNAGYGYLELYIDGSDEPRPVKIRDAIHEKGKQTPKNTMRLFKGDIVKDSKDGQFYRICFFKAAGKIGVLPIWEPRSFKEANEKAPIGTKIGGTISFNQAAKRLTLIS